MQCIIYIQYNKKVKTYACTWFFKTQILMLYRNVVTNTSLRGMVPRGTWYQVGTMVPYHTRIYGIYKYIFITFEMFLSSIDFGMILV